jgi:hypothetical protein
MRGVLTTIKRVLAAGVTGAIVILGVLAFFSAIVGVFVWRQYSACAPQKPVFTAGTIIGDAFGLTACELPKRTP